MGLWIPGTADPGDVLAGKTYSAKDKYIAPGTMPLKTNWNGDGTSANHHLAKDIASVPGTLWLRPVIPADPPTAFQGDVWIQKNEPNFNPAYWRSDVTMFGLQGSIPVRGAGGVVTPGAVPQIKSAGYWSEDIIIAAVPVPANKVLADTTIAGTAGTVPIISAGDDVAIGTAQWGNGDLAVYPREGYRKGGPGAGEIKVTTAQLQSAESDLKPSNIRSGVSIYGVWGTMIEGRRTATGTIQSGDIYRVTVNGLGFTPSEIQLAWTGTAGTGATVYYRLGRSFGQWYCSAVNSANGTEATYMSFSNSQVFAGGFTIDHLASSGKELTWRATE